jgi:hypothetical protein
LIALELYYIILCNLEYLTMSNGDQPDAPLELPQEFHDEDFTELQKVQDVLRQKIKHALTVWPYLSGSMIQIGLGTAVPPVLWRPVLQSMIDQKEITVLEIYARSPTGRDQKYTVYKLSSNPKHPLQEVAKV